MITLQEYRTRDEFIGRDRPSGDAHKRLIVDYLGTIEDHGYMTFIQGDIK